MAVNVRALLFLSKLVVAHMPAGGSIVNISSNGAMRAHRGRLIYDVSKAALEPASRAMALELAPAGIRVNTVVPGDVRTERWEHLNQEEIARRRFYIPLRKETTGEDVAAAVAFLCSEAAANIVGARLVVDGGISIQLRPEG